MNSRQSRIVPLIVFVGIFLIVHNWPRIDLWFDPIDTRGLNEQDVIVYTTSWCPYCKQTIQFLQSAGIPYIEHDIEKSDSARKAYEQLSGRGVPVLQIGDTVIEGYDAAQIRDAINTLRSSSLKPESVPDT